MSGQRVVLLSSQSDELEQQLAALPNLADTVEVHRRFDEVPCPNTDRPLLQAPHTLVILCYQWEVNELQAALEQFFSLPFRRSVFSFLFIIAPQQLQSIAMHITEYDDFMLHSLEPEALAYKLECMAQRCVQLKKLTRDLHEASDIALLSMSHSSELGEISRFILKSYHCRSYQELIDELFETITVFSVSCSALILVDDQICFRASAEAGPRVQELMLKCHNQNRIYHFGADMFISFAHASILIHKMPIENDQSYGRLMDNLTVLANCFEARAKGIYIEEKAETANRAKTMFLANMSHELRTPMNSVIGFTERLIKKLHGRISDKEFRHLQTIQRNGHHLLSIINDILDMSKIEVGLMQIHPEEVDACKLIGNVFDQLQPIAANANLQFELHNEHAAMPIFVDSTRFTQIVMNLTSNAIKYTEVGSVTLSLNEGVDESIGDCVVVEVKDTGIGISKEDQARLFNNFSQIDSALSRKVEGTGLGLAISMAFATMHGGRIDVVSEENQGSCFSLTLPKRYDEERHEIVNQKLEQDDT